MRKWQAFLKIIHDEMSRVAINVKTLLAAADDDNVVDEDAHSRRHDENHPQNLHWFQIREWRETKWYRLWDGGDDVATMMILSFDEILCNILILDGLINEFHEVLEKNS